MTDIAAISDPGAALAAMLAERARTLPHHPDGIYFGLDEDVYRADPALGSTDMRTLAYAPCDYWYGSWMNQERPAETDTPAQARGTALHVLAFQGEAEFDRRYMRGPDNDGFSPAEKTARTKAANKQAAELRLVCLPARDYDRIAIVAKKVVANPYLRECFSGGAGEVSVFWTEVHILQNAKPNWAMPIRKKARLDYVKPRGVGDLKSVANQHEIPFPRACINAVTNYNYHVQAAHYLAARAVMPKLIGAGAVSFPAQPVHDTPNLLERIVSEKRFAWQWVFWQSDRAPITWSRVLSPGNPMLDMARSVLRRAEQNFLTYMQKFGPAQIWIEDDKPAELYVEDMPAWFGRD